MKKRIVCLLLTLIMLIGVLPLGASAAGLAVSEKGITVLKQIQHYSSKCKQYGSEWRNGYGTICTQKGDHANHTIKEVDADKALRTKLKELNTAVNGFVSSTGVKLSQSQFDALVLFSYDAGTAWMNGTGVLRSAIINKAPAGELINAMVNYDDHTGAVTVPEARRIIANMYINGAYSNVPPANYREVTYKVPESDAMMAQGVRDASGALVYTTYFDVSAKTAHAPEPTRGGYTFLGWYIDGQVLSTKLNADCADKTLIARWSKDGQGVEEGFDYRLRKADLASTVVYDGVYVKDGAAHENGKATDHRVTSSFFVTKQYIATDGSRWAYGKLSEKDVWGWVMVKKGSDGAPDDGGAVDVTVTITNSYVNSRVNATIHSATNGSYKQGQKVRIINTANADGFLWGQVAKSADDDTPVGWIALMYTNWNSVKDEDDSTGSGTNTKAIATAVISCKGFLNVRKDAGTDSDIVGALANGDKVDIFEFRFVNGHKWGRTNQGWILLTYAKVTMKNNGNMDFDHSTDVLAYTFTGNLNQAVTPRKDVSDSSDAAGKEVAAGTKVAVSMVKNDGNGDIWGFNGVGWIRLSAVDMDVAKYVVVADSVTVRGDANSSAAAQEKVAKGVELDISKIKVVDATIWGYTEKYNGWVNLASKYVTRSNPPTIENEEGVQETGLIATVINTDSVRVRDYGATYGKVKGSLARGVTVRVWAENDDGWYKIDTDQNGEYDEEKDGWVYGQYLDVRKGVIGGGSNSGNSGSGNNGNNNTNQTVETGMGVVANTYTGVNIRQGAGIGYASVGKYLNGTAVEILEVKQAGAAKWGRTDKGWICMDYVTMVSKYPIGGGKPQEDPNAGQNGGGSSSNTEGSVTTDRTPAVYAGVAMNNVDVLKTADEDALAVRSLSAGDSVTIQELLKITMKVTGTIGDVVDGSGQTTEGEVKYKITYWARTSDGWIIDPQNNLSLNTLDEKTYTVVNVNEVNVRDAANGNTIITTLDKGTQVVVTKLEIVNDKVWGYLENVANGGWVRLDNLSEGAITIKDESNNNNNNNQKPDAGENMGNTGNGGTGGMVTNPSGYKYTGKVIRTNEVNVRSSASTSASKTTVLKEGASLVIYETTIAENMAWGRCDAGWVYLYYVDLTPVTAGVVDARVVYNDNTIIYTDAEGSEVAGTYARMSVIDIYEIVGKMARTDQGWVNTDNLL